MACGAIPESFPVFTAEALVTRRPWEPPAGLIGLSEKQYQVPAGLARLCRFFLIERPDPQSARIRRSSGKPSDLPYKTADRI
jgi:hypothetical protein